MLDAVSLQLRYLSERLQRARTPVEVERHLDAVLAMVAPDVQRFVCQKWGVKRGFLDDASTSEEMDAADSYLTILGLLAGQLRRVQSCEREPIQDLRAYARQIARREYDEYLLKKYPERRILADNLADLFEGRTPCQGLTRWRESGEEWVCGFAAWRDAGRRVVRAAERYQQLLADPSSLAHAADFAPDTADEADLTAAILNFVGGPVAQDDLINGV